MKACRDLIKIGCGGFILALLFVIGLAATQGNSNDNQEASNPEVTQTAEERAREVFEGVFGSRELEQLLVNDLVVTLRFPLTDLSAGSARFEAEHRFVELACELKDAGFTGLTYQITGTITVVDNFGNTHPAEGAELILPSDSIAQMNCENQTYIDLNSIAERFDLHPALQDN